PESALAGRGSAASKSRCCRCGSLAERARRGERRTPHQWGRWVAWAARRRAGEGTRACPSGPKPVPHAGPGGGGQKPFAHSPLRKRLAPTSEKMMLAAHADAAAGRTALSPSALDRAKTTQ